MGRHRVALFGLALAALLTVDGAAAASKSAPRAGSRRSVAKPGGRPIRTPRYREEDEDVDDYGRLEDAGRMSRSRPKSKRTDDRHSSSRLRPSSRSSPSRSNPRYRDRATSTGVRDRGRRSDGWGMEVVPSKRSTSQNSMLAGLAATVKGKAASLQEDAKGKMIEWKKIAKTTVWFSSKMEKFMIQMTWPDDSLLDDVWVKDTMNFLENTGDDSPRSPNNPNKRILRKLWLRMTEQDYRTKLKALQILHHASMDLSPEAHIRVRNQFMKMRDETNHKNRNEVYFEMHDPRAVDGIATDYAALLTCHRVGCQPSRITDVSSSGIPFLPLLRSYSTYTFRRTMDVPGGTKKVASTLRSKKTSQAEAVALLRRLDKLICLGVGCKVDRSTLNTITSQVLHLSARDMMSLWRLYVKGLTRLVKGGYKDGKAASPEAVGLIIRQYSRTQGVLNKYLRHFKRVVRDRSMFEDNQVDPIALEEYLKSVDPSEDSTTTVEEDKDGVGEEEEDDGE